MSNARTIANLASIPAARAYEYVKNGTWTYENFSAWFEACKLVARRREREILSK